MADVKKIDPFDVEALEKSLNDSATRLSALWVSFLIFGLYVSVAAAGVTHEQLTTEVGTIKIPTLDIYIYVIPFFLVGPISFSIYHFYLMVQIAMLARTAAVYNDAVERNIKTGSDRTRIRERLSNAFFAQILAGSRQKGFIRLILYVVAWASLIIMPLLVLLTFQMVFLPYHSHAFTWLHRILIMTDLVAIMAIWSIIKRADAEVRWRNIFAQRIAMVSSSLLVVFSCIILTFPGEPHAQLTRLRTPAEGSSRVLAFGECQESFLSVALPRNFDRLSVLGAKLIDANQLQNIVSEERSRSLPAHQGQRTRSLQYRDLRCGNFAGADLRRANLTEARLSGANFAGANLEGASFDRANGREMLFTDSNLDGASLDLVFFPEADFRFAKLRAASVGRASLQGASLDGAQLQGASLDGVRLQGASLRSAQLQGASLVDAQLQGASLDRAQLQGASLDRAQLQGASLVDAQLQGASLNRAQLQGASFEYANLDDAILSGVWIWRARGATCHDARITDPKNDAVIALKGNFGRGEPVPATPDQIERFITQWVADIPGEQGKEDVRRILRERLTVAKDDTDEFEEAWRRCESNLFMVSQDKFDERHVAVLRATVCDAVSDGTSIGRGVARNWIPKERGELSAQDGERREFGAKLAHALLGEDGKPCVPAKDYDKDTNRLLRKAAAPPPATIKSK